MRNLLCMLLVLLSGCAATDPLPENYSGSVAYLIDTEYPLADSGRSMRERTQKASFFYASEIDGKPIRNSYSETRAKNYGKGMWMGLQSVTREIPLRPMKIKLQARVAHAVPIQNLANSSKLYKAESIVEFEPERNASYVVRGKLSESESEVWLEDARGKRVGIYSVPAK